MSHITVKFQINRNVEETLKASIIFFLTKDQESEWHWTAQEKLWKLEVKIMREKGFNLELYTQTID